LNNDLLNTGKQNRTCPDICVPCHPYSSFSWERKIVARIPTRRQTSIDHVFFTCFDFGL